MDFVTPLFLDKLQYTHRGLEMQITVI
jgi:hypothetical protein